MPVQRLSQLFKGSAVKTLSRVDADPKSSNQHEVGVTGAMKFLGSSPRENCPTRFISVTDDQDVLSVDGTSTYYDARSKSPHRSPEFRLYYPANSVTATMAQDDRLFIALDAEDRIWFITAAAGSNWETELLHLFGLSADTPAIKSLKATRDDPELTPARRRILDELGFLIHDDDDDTWVSEVLGPPNGRFPDTRTMAQLAQDQFPPELVKDDPDLALTSWVTTEERLFRWLEKQEVAVRLEEGFMIGEEADVDGFLSYSLRVQNRRKSRRGHSLEHHVAAVLTNFNIPHDRQAETEDKRKPDFLIPGIAEYRAAEAGDPSLTMLAVKSTLKDRWRQILDEADKIPGKHLLTQQADLSSDQLRQIVGRSVQLVVPLPAQAAYHHIDRVHLWSVREFISDVSARLAHRRMEN